MADLCFFIFPEIHQPKRQIQNKESTKRNGFQRENIPRPWPKIINQRWIDGFFGDVHIVSFNQEVDDEYDSCIDIEPEKCFPN